MTANLLGGMMMRETGLEPVCLAAPDPKTAPERRLARETGLKDRPEGASVARSRTRLQRGDNKSAHTFRPAPEGFRRLDDVDARDLALGVELHTPHPSAGRTPFGWGLVAVLVEGVRESVAGEAGRVECMVVDASMARPAGRVTLAFAPEDLYRRKARRGTIGQA